MAQSAVITFTCFLVGVVIGGGVVFGVMKLTDSSSGSGDSTSATGTRAKDSLKFVVVVSRHGNRGGITDYPSDPCPINSTKYWPYGVNALTPVGRKQEYKLGKKLRSLYNGFLPSTFNSSHVYACSDLYERVVMSGDLVLAGLYPPQGWQKWNKKLDWQPIALYTNSSDHSLLIDYCPRYVAESALATAAFLTQDAANVKNITDYFYQKSNISYTSKELAAMFEKVISEVSEGYSLSEWMKGIYPEPFTTYYKQEFTAANAGSDEVSRLWVGNMLGEMVDTMNSKVSGTSDRKISYYSGHDVTILNLQQALGISSANIVRLVKPGSALIIELHQDLDTASSNYTVQVLFIDGSLSVLEPEELNLKDTCGSPCTFSALVNITQRFTDVNYDEECQTTPDTAQLAKQAHPK